MTARPVVAPSDGALLAAAVMAGLYEAHGKQATISAVDYLTNATDGEIQGAEYLYSMIASWAGLLAELRAIDIAAPGVFAYDVAERFGAWLYECMAANDVPAHDDCMARLEQLTVAHMLREGGNADVARDMVLAVLYPAPACGQSHEADHAHGTPGKLQSCDVCSEKVPYIIGAPCGAEVCQECFDNGAA